MDLEGICQLLLVLLEVVVCSSAVWCDSSYTAAPVRHGPHLLLHNIKYSTVFFEHLS